MNQAFVLDILRTPIGKYGGALSAVRPDDMAAAVISEVVKRCLVNSSEIDDVIIGAANQAGEDNRNVARMALLLAGIPPGVPGVTVNRLCASGLQAIIDAARAIISGHADLIVAGGCESMSRAPFVMPKAETPFGRSTQLYDTTMGWRFTNPALAAMYHPFNMGETAENVAAKFNITREEQDQFALTSQQRYSQANGAGKFDEERMIFLAGENTVVNDEHPRETTLAKLAVLKPVFKKDGTVTAGNSSGINDGAGACVLSSESYLRKHNLSPMARVVSVGIAGVDPAYMGIGPVPATKLALKKAGLNLKDIGLIELNEAFAAQAIACIRELDLDQSIVNVNGGAIAIGHPLGCSGVRISATLLHEMRRRNIRYGLASMCVGVGQGVAVIYENASFK